MTQVARMWKLGSSQVLGCGEHRHLKATFADHRFIVNPTHAVGFRTKNKLFMSVRLTLKVHLHLGL